MRRTRRLWIHYPKKRPSPQLEENTRKLAMMAKKNSFGFQEACGWNPLGEASVRSKLNTLVDLDILGKKGRTRSMRYVFRDPFRDLRREIGETPENIGTDMGRM